MNKRRIRITESGLHRSVKESVNKLLKENDFHRAYNLSKKLHGIGDDDTYTDSDIFHKLHELKTKLRQAEERAKTGLYDEGEARNYLTGAIRGLEAFINSHY